MKKKIYFVLVTVTSLVGLMVISQPLLADRTVAKINKPVLQLLDTFSTLSPEASIPDLTAQDRVSKIKNHVVKSINRVSSEQTVTLLDSIVTSEDGSAILKTVYSYDSFGRRILTASLSANLTTAVWDTISKTELLFNDAGYELLYATYTWNETNQTLEPVNKEVSTYGTDDLGNLTMLRVTSYWDETTQNWQYDTKQEVVFMGQQYGAYYLLISYLFDNQNGWIPQYKYEQDENVDGYSYVNAEYSWSDSLNSWIGQYKSAYVYDEVLYYTKLESQYQWSSDLGIWASRTDETFTSDNLLESRTEYTFDVELQSWITSERILYDYDGDEFFDQLEITQTWDKTNSVWVNFIKTGQEVSDNGETNKYVQYDWDAVANKWIGVTYWSKGWDEAGNLYYDNRYAYSTENEEWVEVYYLWAEYDDLSGDWQVTTWMESEYNMQGLRTSYTQKYRTSSADPWVEYYTYKQVFAFNDSGIRLLVRTYYWSDAIQDWVNAWKREYTLNQAGDIDRSIFYDWSGTDWIETSRSVYYYSDKLVGVQSVQIRLDVFPNPVANRLVITGTTEGDRILVNDINGRLLKVSNARTGETQIDVSDLASGIYLIQVNNQVVKIVKN
jgi:hypothetical protein